MPRLNAAFIVTYDVKGARSQKQFRDPYTARRFYAEQRLARRNPRLLQVIKSRISG